MSQELGSTHLECVQPCGHRICPHFLIVDLEATPFVVCSHISCAVSLVEPLVHVFRRQPQLAELLAEGLCWSEHGRCLVRSRRLGAGPSLGGLRGLWPSNCRPMQSGAYTNATSRTPKEINVSAALSSFGASILWREALTGEVRREVDFPAESRRYLPAGSAGGLLSISLPL